ncbi:hypothetical protein T8J41_13680 [Nitratireductor rhodophyticola]|uniref:hypothetical protein n=1 Tax=Nitratireductor rhodophyticola TaxID=2854036 RepID=UPI002AC97361|nr:hypothetical protein [Nitratireductor rhodophyticola]WPZ13206.1 hypothetical protein T8J41_13680 [Nitratireductor rhodophyticola]
MSEDLIAEAIEEAFGPRCLETVPGCHCCDAWSQYDSLVARAEAAVAARDAAIAIMDSVIASDEASKKRLAEARAEAARMDKAREYFLGERNSCLTIIEKLRSALTSIKRAADGRRREKDGERHQYYFHTADAALENRAAAE